jgi:hypothetical protein
VPCAGRSPTWAKRVSRRAHDRLLLRSRGLAAASDTAGSSDWRTPAFVYPAKQDGVCTDVKSCPSGRARFQALIRASTTRGACLCTSRRADLPKPCSSTGTSFTDEPCVWPCRGMGYDVVNSASGTAGNLIELPGNYCSNLGVRRPAHGSTRFGLIYGADELPLPGHDVSSAWPFKQLGDAAVR